MSRRSSRSVHRPNLLRPTAQRRRERVVRKDTPDGALAGARVLRLATELRAPSGARRRPIVHTRSATRLAAPPARDLAGPPPASVPSEVLGVAAVFGVSLGAVLISLVLGLVGPSWLVAAAMLVSGAALAIVVMARKRAPRAGLGAPSVATPRLAVHPALR